MLSSLSNTRTPSYQWLLESFPGVFLDYMDKDDVLVRSGDVADTTQTQGQTKDMFGFKWRQQDSFSSQAFEEKIASWMKEKYGDPSSYVHSFDAKPLVLDAGCGAGFAGFGYWEQIWDHINYVGIDITDAVFVAKERALKKNLGHCAFIKDNLSHLPFNQPIFDIIFSEGVLHHTDSTEKTFSHLCQFLKKDGYFMFYVYRKKAPIREFTDDYIRELVSHFPPQEVWKKMEPLTQLGKTLGELNLEIDIPNDIDILGIPKGKIDIQRLFYWYIFKCYYSPELSFDEMNHFNFDWYAPKNAFRHTEEELRQWCATNNLDVVYENIELSGITMIGKKR